MYEISPPKARTISRTKVFLDGVAYGRRYTPTQPISRKPLISQSMRRARRQLDAVHLRQTRERFFNWKVLRRGSWFLFRGPFVFFRRFFRRLARTFPFLKGSPKRALYASLVGGVSFGMVSMGLIQNFVASDTVTAHTQNEVLVENNGEGNKIALKEELSAESNQYDPNDDLFLQYFSEATKEDYANQIRVLVKDYPIEDMIPYIMQKDRIVATFLVGIAKKESNWGKRVPVLGGQDCFNYWGYRGIRRLMGTGGHTCFNSRKDAVDTVALRLETLINSEKLDTPAKLIVWKCGYSCDGQSRESVRKWISDVDYYFTELNGNEDEGEPSS